MTKKRILICDDNPIQFGQLKGILDNNYEVLRSSDYKSVAEDLKRHWPVQLLFLDLGFPDGRDISYVGHACIPEVLTKFPFLKIIIFSDITTHENLHQKANDILRELVSYPQVVAFLTPSDRAPRILFEVDRALGTSEWLQNGELWLLHISDIQLGGKGIPVEDESFARTIWAAVESFVEKESVSTGDKVYLYPSLCLLTGDLTERARPSEFDKVERFANEISQLMSRGNPKTDGLIDKHNIIAIPGNHDINWDISFAQNLHPGKTSAPIVYKHGKESIRSELKYLERYSWLPFCEMEIGLPLNDKYWAWDPGYYIYNLINELHIIIVCVNSSRWGVNHLEQKAVLSREMWVKIENELRALDPQKEAMRILLVHHPITNEVDPKDRLRLQDAPDEPRQLIDILSRHCNFSIILSGHYHEFVAESIPTQSSTRTLVNIAAGTAKSSDRKEYRAPTFNLLRLSDMDINSNKFKSLTVYPYLWDGKNFYPYNAFEDNKKSEGKYDLIY